MDGFMNERVDGRKERWLAARIYKFVERRKYRRKKEERVDER